MAGRRLLAALAALLLPGLLGFNLDTRAPVVKLGAGGGESFFGFSVAQHRVSRGAGPVLLVGAPRDSNLQPGTTRSGALYSCPLSSSTGDCRQVVTDGLRRAGGQYDGRVAAEGLRPPLGGEIKEDQWLGGAVSSQGPGGKVAVCAHRYTVRTPSDSRRAMLGMCYILEPDLSLPGQELGATHIMAVREALHGKTLKPKADFDNHDKWGVCQVGTSVSWARTAPNASEYENYALFGAPGCFTWRGNLYGRQTGSIREPQSAVAENNFLEFPKHGHMGLAVTSGIFYDGEVQYVTGAPNVIVGEEGTGEIHFYQRSVRERTLARRPDRTLRGGAFGAGFGSALATVDSNGDSLDDLLVGAPFSGTGGRGGAVFLYLNIRGRLRPDAYLEIRGEGPESQFGLAVSRAGDLNKDGFEDFAVGAPHQQGGGAVYLFLGAREGVAGAPRVGRAWLKAEELASQVVRASELSMRPLTLSPLSPLSTLGSSLSGGLDLDGNGLPDLLVGAYSSGAVVLLKARPIINVTTSLEDTALRSVDPGRAGCPLDPASSHACFHFEACFRVEEAAIQPPGHRIQFSIVAEPKKAVSRVWLRLAGAAGEGEGRSSTLDHLLHIQEGGKRHCTTIIGYVSDLPQTDLKTPVKFALSYSLVQEEPEVQYDTGRPLPSVNRFPILNQQQARRTFYAKFQKNCGSDEVCQAQLSVSPRLLDRESRELGRSAQGAYQLELGTAATKELVLQVEVANLGEAAYEARLGIAFPPSLSYVGPGAGSELAAPAVINSSFLSVDLGNPFKGASEQGANRAQLLLRFAPSSVINQTLIKFDFNVNTTSELAVDSSTYLTCLIVKRAEVTIGGRGLPEAVYYGGEVRGESAMREEGEVGPSVSHRYLIKNYGPSTVDVLTVLVSWPHQAENGRRQGKWLLYLTGMPVVKNGAGSCRLEQGLLPNPLNLTTRAEWAVQHAQTRPGPTAHPRPRREVERVAPAREVLEDGRTRRVVRLDCDRGTAKCLHITCQVYNLRANTSFIIEAKSRLWNATLVEDYGTGVDRVEVVSKASVLVPADYTQEAQNDYESVVTLALPEPKLEPAAGPGWWIYLVAALCGLLLLLTIVAVLSKLGFFKRKRPEEDATDFMVSANFEKVRLSDDL